MSCRRAAATSVRHAVYVAVWIALALVALRPAEAWASNGGSITIQAPADGVFVAGSSLTASFSTATALDGNTPLDVSFVSSSSPAVIPSTYTILSTAGTRYTVRVHVPDLTPGEYTLIIVGNKIPDGKLTSPLFDVAAPPIGAPAHRVPPPLGLSGGLAAAAAAGVLLAVGLALLIVPPLRQRGNQPPR